MIDVGALILAVGAGLGLGLFYFGGLWWTVQRLPSSQAPGVLLLASFAVRTAVVLVGFYFVMAGRWERLLACLVGFVIMRTILIRRIQPVLTEEPTRRESSS